MLLLILLAIFLACVGVLYSEGIWGNAIRLVNVMTAALLTMNYFEPVAAWLEGSSSSYTYFWDVVALWGLFALLLGIFRAVTDFASRVRVRFSPIVERIGGPLLAAWTGWIMVCFTLMTLHTAPLGRTFLFGGFRPETRMFFGFAPDRQWLAYTSWMSERGAFAKSPAQQFDPRAEFMPKYYSRRAALEEHARQTNSFRIR